MTIAELLLPELAEEAANTRKLLELVPEDRFDYAPHPRSMRLGRLAGHLAEIPEWLAVTMQTESLDPSDDAEVFVPTSGQALLDKHDASVEAAQAALAAASDEALAVTWTLLWKGQTVFEMPRRAVIRSMVLNHAVHHRAQLGVYLRLLDVKIPGMYGPSADEIPAA